MPPFQKLAAKFADPVTPANFPKQVLRWRNQRWAQAVGLGGLSDTDWLEHFAGFRPLPGNLPQPLAMRYHGHQFGTYNPDLGDGRGFLFAQLRDPAGRLLDLGTKGSGQTPWSRNGDGRLTLKGGVREILAATYLEALGVNTSKAFSLVETGESLQRNDEPSPTRASVLVRLSHSHIRFGTFQRCAWLEDRAAMAELIDYCVAEFHPAADHPEMAAKTCALLQQIALATGRMIGQWMAAGFVHGVMNTDNFNITGETFDFGPWRFLPLSDPNFTPPPIPTRPASPGSPASPCRAAGRCNSSPPPCCSSPKQKTSPGRWRPTKRPTATASPRTPMPCWVLPRAATMPAISASCRSSMPG